jgi:hypothetical protein
MDLAAWFAQHAAGAPDALRARAAEHLAAVPASASAPATLAAAAEHALAAVLSLGRDRAAALDLLAADALVTLSLLAQAEAGPAELDRFAATLVRRPAA